MKTKRTILSVLMTLVMVASLCAVAAAPASAQGISLDPTSGKVGTLVTIEVEGFAEGQPLIVSYDGAEVATTPSAPETDDSGEATVYFNVPGSIQGDHTVKVAVGVQQATETFDVDPSVSISPATGATGSAATATCRGFAPGYSIDVMATDPDPDVVLGSGSTDSNGSVNVNCTMDAEGTINATDGAGNEASEYENTADFNFTPGITLDPASGPAQIDVTVSGSDFTEGEGDYSVRYRIAGGHWAVFDSLDDDLDSDGEFEGTFTLPAGLSIGGKKVEAGVEFGGWTGRPNETASATFTVESSEISLDPEEGPVGETVVVESSNLPAEADYEIQFDGETVADGQTDTDGSLTNSFEVPDETTGAKYDVAVVIDGETVAEATYSILKTGLTISPEEGRVGTEVEVTGTSYGARDTFNIWYQDVQSGGKSVVGTVTTSSLGSFTTTITIPNATIYDNNLISDSLGLAKAKFDVTAPAVAVTVEDGMSNIWSNLSESVWYFDNATKSWSQYYKANPDAVPSDSKLTNLESGKVYWVYVNANCTLKYGGSTIDLTAGWNVISWP